MADSAVLDTPPPPPPPFFPDHHHPDLFSDLHFDGNLHFSIDDLLDFPDDDDDDDSPKPPLSSSSSSTTTATDPPKPKLSPPKRKREEVEAEEEEREEEEEDEKRKARLLRNRESAQLSRQRKKHYVEELEEKVRSMHSTISDLNARIGLVMAENARLRQQLGPTAGNCPPPAVCAPHVAPFPWIAGYAVRPPPGAAPVPLVPIPRLKTQHANPPKARKGEGKVKKVAGVSLLGLLFLMLVVGGFDFGYRSLESGGRAGRRGGRVMMVVGGVGRLNESGRSGVCGGNNGVCGKGYENGGAKMEEGASRAVPENASEPLVASLYIPRNDRLVKIDGNLIISSVLASERALARRSCKDAEGCKMDGDRVRGGGETDLEVGDASSRKVSSALAVGRSAGREGMRRAGAYVKRPGSQKALPSGSGDVYIDGLGSPAVDGHLQDWFREGLEGPIFSSGMCTEVFQFDASQDSGNVGGIVPATSIANTTTNLTESTPYPRKLKNRRTLYTEPMSLNGSALNDMEGGKFRRSQQDGGTRNTTMGKSMVVSVLIDPREVGDGNDIDGMMPSRTISRIFVVVLVDGGKYVTYSCTLPFKGNMQHLVTA